MSQKFQSSIQHRGDMSYVKLGGVIDEDNELSDLVDKIPVGTAVIDLGEIERINSCGVVAPMPATSSRIRSNV